MHSRNHLFKKLELEKLDERSSRLHWRIAAKQDSSSFSVHSFPSFPPPLAVSHHLATFRQLSCFQMHFETEAAML